MKQSCIMRQCIAVSNFYSDLVCILYKQIHCTNSCVTDNIVVIDGETEIR